MFIRFIIKQLFIAQLNRNKIKLSDSDIANAKQNKKALKKIYLHFINEMYTFAFYLTKSKEGAEDIISESFLKAFANITTFEGNVQQFRAWLYKITRNTAYDYMNKESKSISNEEIFENISEVDNLSEDEKESLNEIWYMISKLDAKSREIILLKYKFGYDLKEVSEITGESYANVRKIASRSLKNIKNNISKND